MAGARGHVQVFEVEGRAVGELCESVVLFAAERWWGAMNLHEMYECAVLQRKVSKCVSSYPRKRCFFD